jgi:DNA-binding FadR family transcriptional regulator
VNPIASGDAQFLAALVAAVCAGDDPLAARRMWRHVQFVRSLLESRDLAASQ